MHHCREGEEKRNIVIRTIFSCWSIESVKGKKRNWRINLDFHWRIWIKENQSTDLNICQRCSQLFISDRWKRFDWRMDRWWWWSMLIFLFNDCFIQLTGSNRNSIFSLQTKTRRNENSELCNYTVTNTLHFRNNAQEAKICCSSINFNTRVLNEYRQGSLGQSMQNIFMMMSLQNNRSPLQINRDGKTKRKKHNDHALNFQ